MNKNKLETITNLFEGRKIRSIWDSEKEEYYFSVIDVIGALTNAHIPRNYWSDLKRKLINEGSQLHEKIVRLKMKAQDGKYRGTHVLDMERIFRLIESVPSPKAEPFKLWLAKLGKEEIDNVFDPLKGIDKMIDYYLKNMTDIEVVLTDLGELATRELVNKYKPLGIDENKEIAKRGGNVAKIARKNLEHELGETVISDKNNLNYQYISDDLIEHK